MQPVNQETIYLHLCETFKEVPFYKNDNGTRELDSNGEHYEYLFRRYKNTQGIKNDK